MITMKMHDVDDLDALMIWTDEYGEMNSAKQRLRLQRTGH